MTDTADIPATTGDQRAELVACPKELSANQLMWLRGLEFGGGRYILMSASELGNIEVSELQSLGLVLVADLMDGKNWRITSDGSAALSRATSSEGTPAI